MNCNNQNGEMHCYESTSNYPKIIWIPCLAVTALGFIEPTLTNLDTAIDYLTRYKNNPKMVAAVIFLGDKHARGKTKTAAYMMLRYLQDYYPDLSKIFGDKFILENTTSNDRLSVKNALILLQEKVLLKQQEHILCTTPWHGKILSRILRYNLKRNDRLGMKDKEITVLESQNLSRDTLRERIKHWLKYFGVLITPSA